MKRRVRVQVKDIPKGKPLLSLHDVLKQVFEGARERVTEDYLIILTSRGFKIPTNFGVHHIVEYFRKNVDPYYWNISHHVWDLEQFQMRESFWKGLAAKRLPRGWGQPLRILWRERQDAGLEPILEPESYLRILLHRNPEALKQFQNMRLGKLVDLGDELPVIEFADAEKLKLALETFVLGDEFWPEIRYIAQEYVPWMSANAPEDILAECQAAGLELEKARILEAGCGQATLIRHLAEQFSGAQCIGLDQQQLPLNFARQEGLPPNLELVHSPLKKYTGQKFDFIFIGSVCGALTKRGLGEFLADANQLLKEGGCLIAYPQTESTRGVCRIFRKLDEFGFSEV